MPKRTMCLCFVVCFLAQSASAGVINKIVVFPTADSLRVVATLRSGEAPSRVSLSAEIRPTGDGPALWTGPLGTVDLPADKPITFEKTISDLKPRLWSPGSPVLYEVMITAGHGGMAVDNRKLRTGFRSVESRDGQILLNGRPIFLRGLAINPPGRGVPDETAFTREFAHDYVRFMRSRNFNCIRMNLEFVADPRAQFWFDACDELGMMIYQGCYGSPPTGRADHRQDKTEPPRDLDASIAAYQGVFETYARHPAIIIYILSNELPYQGARGQAWHEFLIDACERLKAWDSTRLYIGSAGYGEGKEGDINDVHRYWGWYYNSFLTYYNLRKAHEIYGDEGAIQPFTFSECVGSFTSTLGEFNLIFRKQLGAQLHWTGHSRDQAEDALAYQAFMANRACESFRTMREVNPRLAGIMPFTILYFNWNGITRFDQMKPKPVADAMATAYQPILLAWELWTRQVYAGTTIQPIAHVINDAEDFLDLADATLVHQLANRSGKPIVSGKKPLAAIRYFGHHRHRLSISIPFIDAPGDYTLSGTLVRDGKSVSRNEVPLFIDVGTTIPLSSFTPTKDHLLYDPSGATAAALSALGIKTRPISDLSKLRPDVHLIIGEDASPHQDISEFIRQGGRVLMLGQDRNFKASWLPARIEMLTGTANSTQYHNRPRPTADQMYINIERPDHPIFAGLDRSRFRLWSDYTNWDQRKPGFPAIYPVTHGFRLTHAEDLVRVAILANYDRGLEGMAICEMFDGKGSIVFTSLDLVKRIRLDPIADKVLVNLVDYLSADDHPVHPLIDEPILWGRYATEKGVIAGPLNGLVVNCRWVRPPTDPDARPLPDNQGAWNILPGDQYVPVGRRLIGPYSYNAGTATVESDKESKTGTGLFHASLPPGRRVMITKIENPANHDGHIEVEVNGRGQAFFIPAGQTKSVHSDLAGEPTTVSVRHTGDKRLVLLESSFE